MTVSVYQVGRSRCVTIKPMISAVVLAHNSGDTIGKTLQSLEWCDEVIVVDDDSTDNTREIARTHKARVVKRKLEDDFAAQRNSGLSMAKGDWVLFVDSDEVVTPELAGEIEKKASERQSVNVSGYYLKRKDWMFGKWLAHGETSRVKLVRLARRDAGTWRRPVHEVWQIQGIVGELNSPLLHYPHKNVAQFIDEVNRYSTLNARFFYAQGAKCPWWHILVYPKAKFFVDYIWYLGFLDGTAGAIVAIMMSFHSFLTRAKLYFLTHGNEKAV